jgi:hypothetical protein
MCPSTAPKIQELIGPNFDFSWADFIGRGTVQDFHPSALADADDFYNEFH